MKFLKTKKYRILSNISKYSFMLVLALVMITPILFVNADADTVGTNITTSINNPIRSDIDTIPKFINAIVEAVLVIGIPIVVLAIIYTGFLFVKAQGNSEELTKAKKALLYTLIGAALLLGAFVIANAIQATVDDITKTS